MGNASWQTDSASPADTEKIAGQIGQNLRGGEVIELISDLGGGKTTFVRGLVRGIESDDHVSSPTFKLSNEYKGKKFYVLHFDFYRLSEPGIMSDELAESIGDPGNVVVVEWADVVQSVLPTERLSVTFANTGENKRHLRFTYPGSLAYLMDGLL